jgi:hypothetical protein
MCACRLVCTPWKSDESACIHCDPNPLLHTAKLSVWCLFFFSALFFLPVTLRCKPFSRNFLKHVTLNIIVLCGCETWCPTLREAHFVRVFKSSVLRKLPGPEREITGYWRKLHDFYSYVVKSRRMRWVGIVVETSWNVMAHAQKPDFVFRRNGRVHLNRRGRQFSRLLAAEVCASAVVMLDTPCSEVVWRILATHSIRQFPLHFPSLRHRVPSHFNWSLRMW